MEVEMSISYKDYLVKFRNLIKELGLNNSIQKEYILKVLFDSKDTHLNTEEILQKIKIEHKVNIGMATVYRILNLLEELKIVKSISIDGLESKVYELNLSSHHDHMVCVKCVSIVEFYDAELEKIQELVAQEKGFLLQRHTMMLYGVCKECQENE